MNKQVLDRAVSFIDSWLLYRYEKLDMPGFVVAIAHDKDIVFKQAYGYANLEQRERMTVDHIFRIASHSKTFTATAITQMAEKNLLNIDDPVVKYIPWLSKHRDPRMTQVSIRQLMSHSAGIIRDGLDANFWQLSKPFPDSTEFKEEFLKTDLVYDNNKRMKYSNFGYTLLGCLIEEVSDIPFNLYTQEKIIHPLGLSNTGPEFVQVIAPHLVTGYTRSDTEKHRLPISQYIDTKSMSCATGFYSTAADMCQYFQAHFVGSGKLLTDESKKEMQRTQWRIKNTKDDEEYGLGFALDHFGEHNLFGHGGGFPGQRTKTFCDSEARLVVVVLVNCIDGDPRAIGKGIIDSVIDHFENSNNQAQEGSIDELQRFEGRFMNLWNEIDIVESGCKLIAINPNTWSPFGEDQEIQVLEPIDHCTLKIVSASGYASEGQLVTYTFDDSGSVKCIRYAGYDMLPEAQYKNKIAKMKSEKSLFELPA